MQNWSRNRFQWLLYDIFYYKTVPMKMYSFYWKTVPFSLERLKKSYISHISWLLCNYSYKLQLNFSAVRGGGKGDHILPPMKCDVPIKILIWLLSRVKFKVIWKLYVQVHALYLYICCSFDVFLEIKVTLKWHAINLQKERNDSPTSLHTNFSCS